MSPQFRKKVIPVIVSLNLLTCSENNPFNYTFNLQSDASWFHQNPIPTSNSLTDVEYLSQDEILISSSNKTLLSSRDAGDTWVEKEFFTANAQDIHFVGQESGWAVGDRGMIMHTRDGGRTWEEQISGVTSDLSSVYFVDETNGMAVGKGGVILRTEDGGRMWCSQVIDSVYTLEDVVFLNSEEGWAIGISMKASLNDALLHTSDGGETWKWESTRILSTMVDTNACWGLDPYVWLRSIDAINEDTIIIVGEGWLGGMTSGVIVETFDGGISWKAEPTYYSNYDVLYVKSHQNRFLEGGSRKFPRTGQISTNGNRKLLKSHILLSSMDFIDSDHGCAVGFGGYICFTQDGGETWPERSEKLRTGIGGIQFLDSLNGWLACGNGIYKSVDGGSSWELTAGKATHLVQFFDSLNGKACNYATDVDITTDGGNTWSRVRYPKMFRIRDMHFINNSTGWISGDPYILRTDDGGYTWAEQWWNGRYGPWIDGVYFVDSLHGWAIVDGGIFLRTVDGGWNWTKQTIPEISSFKDVFFLDTLKGWVVGASTGRTVTAVFLTNDGGVTWEKTTLDVPWFVVTSIRFIDPMNGWAVGTGGRIIHTIDGGRNWEFQKSPTTMDLYSIWPMDSTRIWAVGSVGVILHTEKGGR